MLKTMKHQRVNSLATAIFAVAALTGANQVWAGTAATATVRNVVTVDYKNAAAVAQPTLTAAVDVIVNLVKGTAVVSAPADQTVAGSVATYSYTVTNTSNGINTYNISAGVTESNISGSTVSTSVPSVVLGATTVTTGVSIPAATATVITVPRDSLADSSVNGIANGDTVVIGGLVYTVSAIADVQAPASPSTAVTTTITVTGPAQVVTAGTLIAEQKTITMSVTPGSLTSSSTDGTVTGTLTVTDGTTAPATDGTITTVTSIGLTVTKLVRNVTAPVVGAGPVTYATFTYYASGVTANPGEVLEYLIVASKSASASSATAVKVADPIPAFTTYVASSMGIDPNSSGTFTALSDSDSNGDAGETDSNTVYFYPGTGGTDGAAGVNNGTGGTLVTSAVSRMKFRVTVQ